MTNFCVALHHRGVISLQGEDHYTLLQGLITNDIHLLKEKGILFTALLSPQGRFLHDFFIIEQDDILYLTPEKERTPDLLSLLQKHKLRSRVAIQDISDCMRLYAAWGGACPSSFKIDPRLDQMGYLRLFPNDTCPEEQGSFEDYDRHRIMLAVPDGSRDLVIDKAIILENNYHELHGISFEKGCYVGQELMSRTHHRGLVRKRLMTVKIEGPLPPFGSALFHQGVRMGTMKSSVGDVGLALLQIDSVTISLEAENGARVTKTSSAEPESNNPQALP